MCGSGDGIFDFTYSKPIRRISGDSCRVDAYIAGKCKIFFDVIVGQRNFDLLASRLAVSFAAGHSGTGRSIIWSSGRVLPHCRDASLDRDRWLAFCA